MQSARGSNDAMQAVVALAQGMAKICAHVGSLTLVGFPFRYINRYFVVALKNIAHSVIAPTQRVALLENRIDCPSQSQLFCIFRV